MAKRKLCRVMIDRGYRTGLVANRRGKKGKRVQNCGGQRGLVKSRRKRR